MSDLISRQAAIDMVKEVCKAVMSECESLYVPEFKDEVYNIREVNAILKCNKKIRIALQNMPSTDKAMIMDMIGKQPTVDAVPVVRCKDCKHKEEEQAGMIYCSNIGGEWVTNNWFCADGERRADNG